MQWFVHTQGCAASHRVAPERLVAPEGPLPIGCHCPPTRPARQQDLPSGFLVCGAGRFPESVCVCVCPVTRGLWAAWCVPFTHSPPCLPRLPLAGALGRPGAQESWGAGFCEPVGIPGARACE